MKTHGQIAYEEYQRVLLEEARCGTDGWDELEESDRAAWEAAARLTWSRALGMS